MEKVEIKTCNHNEELHGYQEWYEDKKLWLRGTAKNGEPKDYQETHDGKWSETQFFIK